MKRISLFALLLSILFICASATPLQNNRPVFHHPQQQRFDTWYYWYDASSGNYVDYNSVGNEISQLEGEIGCPVNETAAGGTEVEDGYIDDTDPHDAWAAVLLYSHC